MNATSLIDAVMLWAMDRNDVHALALVGSHARGTQRPDSDVDLVLLVVEPSVLLHDRAWISRFGTIVSVVPEDWGRLQSLRVHYGGGPELELGIAGLNWAAVKPLDPGTAAVVSDGMKALYDPAGLLEALQRACADNARRP